MPTTMRMTAKSTFIRPPPPAGRCSGDVVDVAVVSVAVAIGEAPVVVVVIRGAPPPPAACSLCVDGAGGCGVVVFVVLCGTGTSPPVDTGGEVVVFSATRGFRGVTDAEATFFGGVCLWEDFAGA